MQLYYYIFNLFFLFTSIQNLVPPDHLLLASAKRVKALILEEIALDTPAGQDLNGNAAYLMLTSKFKV